MTIDEAIEQFKDDVEYNRANFEMDYAEENEQFANWLEELKTYKDGTHDKHIRADEREHTLIKLLFTLGNEIPSYSDNVLGEEVIKVDVLRSLIQGIAEQLKENINGKAN